MTRDEFLHQWGNDCKCGRADCAEAMARDLDALLAAACAEALEEAAKGDV